MILIAGLSDFKNLINSISQINFFWLSAGMIVVLFKWIMESIIMTTIGFRKGINFLKSFFLTMIGQLFNSITPFATGGQPMQAYYMSKMNIDVSSGIAILIAKFIVYQLVVTIYGFIILSWKFMEVSSYVSKLSLLAFLGFGLNISVIFLLLLFSYNPSLTEKIIKWFIGILKKFRLKVSEQKVLEKLSSFHSAMVEYLSSFKILIGAFFFTFLQLLLNLSLPFFVAKSLNVENLSFLKAITFQSIVWLILSLIPTPGTTGAAEGLFFIFFKPFFGIEKIAMAIIIWRLLSYYLNIIVGGLFFTSSQRRFL
ncbi:MAG: glycosyltransferase 2 family protein [Thermotogaceae bacterium]|nr:glycosyltransferase 2 family protein [Thermotogaceae bacterium]